MKIHYMQHVRFENPGYILEWAKMSGHELSNTQVYHDEPLPRQSEFDWLVIMGGPMNIYEEDQYTWLAREKKFIRESIESGKVVLGFCLGGQLLADVIGGKVVKNHAKEIGWFPVRLLKAAKENPLFSDFPAEPIVFQWHGDTFGQLPEDAILLADSAVCAHQAFVYRSRVFGFQFHLENTMPIIEGLVENCRDEMVLDQYVQTPEEVLSHPEYIRQDNEWMNSFLSKLFYAYQEGLL